MDWPSFFGQMVEWFKAPVLKTGVGANPPWVRIPLCPEREHQGVKREDLGILKSFFLIGDYDVHDSPPAT